MKQRQKLVYNVLSKNLSHSVDPAEFAKLDPERRKFTEMRKSMQNGDSGSKVALGPGSLHDVLYYSYVVSMRGFALHMDETGDAIQALPHHH
jgi:hypothetical protein